MVDKFIHAVQQCTLHLTTKAKDALIELYSSEHLLFDTQREFFAYFEKRAANAPGETNVTIYIDARENEDLHDLLRGRIGVMNAILRNTGLLATNFYIADTRFPLPTTRRLRARVTLNTHTANAQMPIPFYKALRQLPNAEEKQATIKKRIASWEGYLKIQEQNASIEDIHATYTKYRCNDDFTRLTLTIADISPKQLRQLNGLAVALPGYSDMLGDVIRVNAGQVEVELHAKATERLRQHKLPQRSGDVQFSNFASLSQIRRLRKGFTDLAKGHVANPHLEDILFEEIPQIEPPSETVTLQFHNTLNEYQQEAVIGAMSANDLYCIQGPPGTGKTTVISEICYQNAQAGLTTLVASQSNLAVDNALSRLLKDKDIRILRYGRTESIEEEGKKFIEENIGHYWLDTTRSEIERHLYNQQADEQQLQQQQAQLAQNMDENTQRQAQLHEQISAKATAKIELRQLNSVIHPLHTQIDTLAAPRKVLEQEVTKLLNQYNKIYHQRIELEAFINNTLDGSSLTAKIHDLNDRIQETQAKRKYIQLQQQTEELTLELATKKEQLAALQQKVTHLEQLLQDIQGCDNTRSVQALTAQYNLQLSALAQGKLQEALAYEQQFHEFERLKEVNQRLVHAITFLEQKLAQQAQHILPAWVGQISIEEINTLISSMKEALITQGRVTLQTLGQFLANMRGAKESLNAQGHRLKAGALAYQQVWQRAFALVAHDASTQLRFAQKDVTQFMQHLPTLQQQIAQNDTLIQQLRLKLTLPIDESTHALARLSNEYVNQYSALQAQASTLKRKQLDVQQLLAQEQPIKALLDDKRALLDASLQQEMEILEQLDGLEKQRQVYKTIIEQQPEEQLLAAQHHATELHMQQQHLAQQLEQLPLKNALQHEWRNMLQTATEHDVDDIKKLYIKHANVIGTTCVQSARKDFIESYPQFDVVIIDEVSKATPPELLLPMLKGKKIILVGDHHQLPPLLGDDTLEETLSDVLKDSTAFEGQQELEGYLRESLFERLFKALPATNKQMLAIQYRMHENIMAGIAPFYAQEQDGLHCGLANSQAMRDHLLEGRFMTRRDHLLWIDLPTKKPYFEQRVQNGSSLFNEGELQAIRDILQDMNEATALAKARGDLEQHQQKSVGVISFYGEQVKKINRLIQQELQLPHLHIRTGTVDKFQGMEMDVILVSMVRNIEASQGHIGFARDYRRLNVAVSRAKELCMMIGSSEMFTKKEKNAAARHMYQTLYDTIALQQGIRPLEQVEVV